MKTVALIPCHNEEAYIHDTLSSIIELGIFDEIIVIDDASKDNTAAIAAEFKVRVLRLHFNVGKGAALEYGSKRIEDADVIALLDGDLGTSAAEVMSLLEPVHKGEADMTIASFPKAGKAGFGLVKNIAQKAIDKHTSGFETTAPLSGQRVMTATCLEAVRPFASGYGVEVVMTIRALRAGMRLLEVPTTMTHAATGRDLSGFIHRGKQYVHVKLALQKLERALKKEAKTSAQSFN